MKRCWLVVALTVGAAAVVAGAVLGPSATASGGPGDRGRGYGYARYFAISCGFSHRNDDDPIVFPNAPGRSHNHTFFGNTSTNALSTPGSLRAAGRTSCRLRADTAAYWVPTLLMNGQPVEPLRVTAYYVRRTFGRVQAFPQGLQVIAGSAAARSPQSLDITSWNCAARDGIPPSSGVPTCTNGRRAGLLLQVNFPNCWNGTSLDSADHQSHMAYSDDGVCPASHAVAVPALTLVVRYLVEGGSAAELSSVGQFSAHADFVNAWDQAHLTRLVNYCLNALRPCGANR
jgi:hypothetical protein